MYTLICRTLVISSRIGWVYLYLSAKKKEDPEILFFFMPFCVGPGTKEFQDIWPPEKMPSQKGELVTSL